VGLCGLDALLSAEGRAAAIYWRAFVDRPVRFARVDAVPANWRTLGSRISPISTSGQHAVSPAMAVWNYLYAVMASALTIALHAAGPDPALSCLHLDREDRASAAYDLLELGRPIVDAWTLHWLATAKFNKRDFHEDSRGVVSIASSGRSPHISP
jgi:CRISPR/Cas system-associated endonuclease Cas1